MRGADPKVVIGLAMGASLLLIGCGQSEERVRDELRHQFLSRCAADIAPTAAKSPGFDTERFCGCLADKALEGRDVRQVRELFDDSEKSATLARQAGMECRPLDAPDRPDAGPPPPTAEETAASLREARLEREREARAREERLEKERTQRDAERAREPARDGPTTPVVTPPPGTAPAPTSTPTAPPRPAPPASPPAAPRPQPTLPPEPQTK